MITHALTHLARGQRAVELAISDPGRLPFWDAVVLTAAHEAQAHLYRLRLAEARAGGRLPAAMPVLVAADPGGKRIGSGGATLHALAAAATALDGLTGRRVLIIHSGGDSRRVPWANVLGKVFIPLPLLAGPDQAVPTLFDQILAVSAPLAGVLAGGGLAVLTGDVLPLFDAGALSLPADGALVVTRPATLDVAARHGVVVAPGHPQGGPVADLLQKPDLARLQAAGGLVRNACALLDTGIFCFAGPAFAALAGLAADASLVAGLAHENLECSLYEELASALVPSRHAWLARRPLGGPLQAALGGLRLHHQAVDDLEFVHFGTQPEIAAHLADAWQGRLARRMHARHGPEVSPSAVLLESRLDHAVSVGAASLVAGCRLGPGWRIGDHAVVLGVDDQHQSARVADHRALWQVPVHDGEVATLLAGAFDEPNASGTAARFLNGSLATWMARRSVEAAELWPEGGAQTLWRARLFPVGRPADWRILAGALLDDDPTPAVIAAWRAAQRLAYADLAQSADAEAMLARWRGITAPLLRESLDRCLDGGLDRDVHRLALLARLAGAPPPPAPGGAVWPSECRRLQVEADLHEAAGQTAPAAETGARAFAAVQQAVALAVPQVEERPVRGLPPGGRFAVELPVRFDIAGGWTDTPPACLEQPGAVLNLALLLEGRPSVGAAVEVLDRPEVRLRLGDEAVVRYDRIPACGLEHPHLLPLTALRLCGWADDEGRISQGCGLHLWSRAPRGSGLGASSILGAAVVSALQRAAGRLGEGPEAIRSVAELVLVLEQRMTTGGGWQDQLGGLMPGVKLCTSRPTRPLALSIEPVPLLEAVREDLHRRLVVFFTGQQRLARNVLQIVVGRYLRRDHAVLGALDDLAGLAAAARGALSSGDLSGVGAVMDEAWQVHQRLDAHCSNPGVDALFRSLADWSCGAKLAGAGGGGCAAVMAKDAEAAERIRAHLRQVGGGVAVYGWKLWEGEVLG